MIGFILGTSEGKNILRYINRFTDEVVVSTATEYGGELLKEYKFKYLNTKPLDRDGLVDLINKFNIKVLVDASHPYAKEVSNNAIESAKECNIDYIRYERLGVLKESNYKKISYISGYDKLKDSVKHIDGNILNTTGSRNIETIYNLNIKNRIIHRILPNAKILQNVLNIGVNVEDVIAIKGPISYELNRAFINQYSAKAIITKDSGKAGGTIEKLKACIDENIDIIVIDKPNMEYGITFSDEKELVDYLIDKYSIV